MTKYTLCLFNPIIQTPPLVKMNVDLPQCLIKHAFIQTVASIRGNTVCLDLDQT